MAPWMRAPILAALLVLMATATAFCEQAPEKIFKLAKAQLAPLGTNPAIVTAVKEANAKGSSLGDIQKMDETWRKTPGIADYMEAMMTSDCGKFLRQVQNATPYFAEIFVMDNQGANVAMTDKTSDYWQGDEAKFKNAFNNGQGAVFVDEVEFDESSQVYLVQVSVPVKDQGEAIGAITFGIDLDQVE